MTTLETPRLILRKFTEDDLDRLAELMSDPGFMKFSGSGPFTRGEAAASLERMLAAERAGRPSQFAVVLRETRVLIGYCGFFVQTVDDKEEVEIGYRLDPTYWGRGLATEAARAVRDHAFRDLRLPRVISLIHPDNAASIRVAEKNGMTQRRQTTWRGFPTLIFQVDKIPADA